MAKLNEKQIAAVTILALPKRGGLTYQQVADKVGVSRQALVDWRKRDDFNKALKDEIVRNTLDTMPEIMESIPNHIINDGNAALFRTLLQAHGMLTEKHEIETASKAEDTDAMKAEIEKFRSRLENGSNVKPD
ncbi:transcriptional regulator with XRE-family HTH domain [Virgibacillus halotolerans]|uniref:phBC6A51 family helix-turn-helix protein n=1 Tax=Virgibacillus halotolerans TaxID=1071053 RepID=UPI00196089CB|nr:phBC6A51 family helix-turn-helix protein [Virgibacillus halotolerans]MBM7600438.1 transcriptional regulator with XRE-family HTH domain [Virgibacillus halotolerans]